MMGRNIFPGFSLFILFIFYFSHSVAQGIAGGAIHGNFELDAQYYRTDSSIGTPAVPEKMLSNGFANFIYEKDNFSAGLRYESYLDPMLGFDPRYKGSGITYRYLSYKNEEMEITVGNFYEQFGSGIIFRSYEERGLGLDNAMEGLRLKYNPYKGIYFKGVIGNQRDFFSKGEGIVRGGDAEINLNETFSCLASSKTKWIIGGSFVSKFQDDQDPVYILPKNVGAGSGRINMIHGNLNISAEYSIKANDPSSVNKYIYKTGDATIVNVIYSKKGFGASLGAKRIDNMSFRSDRSATLNSLMINYLPAMTRQHTNMLSAFYPYATQPNGEFGFQGEIFFNLKQGTKSGGSYGTDVTLNYSRASDIDHQPTGDDLGYTSDYLKFGKEIFFQDFNIEVNRKVSKKLRLILSYVYLDYNKDIIQGSRGIGHVYSNIAMAELNWKINSKNAIRTELQHLYTKQDQQSWALWLVEYTVAPHWFVAAFDEYNYGNEIKDSRLHYYNGSFGYTKNSNRVSLGFGRQRAGIFCVGGVCRNVPASNGFTLSVTSSF
ncbi:MAG: DUF6029 family protein [Bacteroidetes bacterium]|nr:DUF6029 family protein [Bacteroidota bacterium]